MISSEVLSLLGCPVCAERSPLKLVGSYLVCTKDGVGFPIANGIPQLLPECAIPADQMEKAQ